MNASERNRCHCCGAEIPAQSTESLCPACLMSGALVAADSVAATLVSSSPNSLSEYEKLEFPCSWGGYRLLGLLGRGGMGIVYEAEESATGRRVALKMLGQQLDSPELRRRFLREGRLAAGVNHPNSLYVFGSEEIEGTPVITMEIAGSGTLKDRLEKRGPLPVAESVDAVLDVIGGLEAAYNAGVLHRDIKPSNCFVSPDGSVKVGDFGLSVSTLAEDDSYLTATGAIMGTPAYASPEQLRGDELDLRSDIYSVGATLFTLLTGRAPFEGKNAAQVVANAVNKKPAPLGQFRQDILPGLNRVVSRCLAKEADARYSSYEALRSALLPFSSREPAPAPLTVRAPAGWIDYLIAFLIPYLAFTFSIGSEEFHLRLFMERTLYSARHYLAFLGLGFLYFTLAEGIWGAGLGKYLKGLRVVRAGGRPVGMGRALIRIVVPIVAIEIVRVPFLMASISSTHINDMTTSEVVLYSAATFICPWIPVLFMLSARRENGYATFWDLVSGTRVVFRPEGKMRSQIAPFAWAEFSGGVGNSLGPYRIIKEIDPDRWIIATDPVLRREVWLLRRNSAELCSTRRNLGRKGRLRWLQKVEQTDTTWDAFEAVQGASFSSLVGERKQLPWGTLRHWLHDLVSELWSASMDKTLPANLSSDHVWISKQGYAVLLDRPWPEVKSSAASIPVGDLAGQQRFLSSIAAHVESTSLPLHARPLLRNLENGKFEKLSFLTGTLRGFLERPTEVSRGIRAGSIFMLPLYVWIMFFVGASQGAEWLYRITGDSVWMVALATALLVAGGSAMIQLMELPFRTTFGLSIFRLAVIDTHGERAPVSKLLARWAITWLPLVLPMSLVGLLMGRAPFLSLVVLIFVFWLSLAAYSVINPNRGLHDRLAGTWVVRQ